MSQTNHPVWIDHGTIELDNGEKLTIVGGVCLEKGCSIELVSGSVTSLHEIVVSVTPSQTTMPRHIEGVLTHGTIKLPNGSRLMSMSREVPVKNGAIVRIFMQSKA